MFDIGAVEGVFLLMLFGGLIAGIYLTVRLARRRTSPDERI